MALGDGTTWDESLPNNDTEAVQIDDYNRDLRVGIRGRMANEHEWPASQSLTNEAGQHKFITYQQQGSIPSMGSTQKAVTYVNTDGAFVYASSGGAATVIINSGGDIDVPSQLVVGMMVPYGAAAASMATNTGWAICYGGTLSRSTDSALFAAIGVAFGSGDGSTTFNVPDMRQRYAFGASDTAGSAGECLVGDENTSRPLSGTGDNIEMKSGTNGKQDGTGTGTAANIDLMMPYMGVNWIIKR